MANTVMAIKKLQSPRERDMKLFSLNRVTRVSLVAFLTVATLAALGSTCFSEEPTVTPNFIYIYGYGPLSIGDVVSVFTEDGVLCGKSIVTVDGQYGQMAVYGDDPLTAYVVEGARSGEKLLIKINDEEVYFSVGGTPVFGRDGETYQVDLD